MFEGIDQAGNIIKLVAKYPTQEVINEGDLIYNIEISKAIRRGVMSRQEAVFLSKERGLWTDANEKDFESFRKRIRECEIKLKKGGISKKIGRRIAEEMSDCRTKIAELVSKRDSLMGHTAENYASAIRDQFYVSACVFDAETDELYFDSFEDYLLRSNETLSLIAYQEVLYLINDIDPDYARNNAENQYMIKNGIMDENGRYRNEEGKMVDREGRRINKNFEFVLDYEGEEIKCDEFGTPLTKDGEIDIEMLEKISGEKSEEPVGEATEEAQEEEKTEETPNEDSSTF